MGIEILNSQFVEKLDWCKKILQKILEKVLTPTLRDTVFSEVEGS